MSLLTLTAPSFNALYHRALQDVNHWEHDQPSRNGLTLEVHPALLQLTDLRYRSLTLLRRQKSLGLQLMELLWIWAGSDELAPLAAVLPRWRKYSDDGVTLHGAYGRRLRNWDGRDQLTDCLELLRAKPDTRQAVMMIWNPAQDLARVTKDVPCNNWLHWLLRDGRLDLTVVVRSNDLWHGVPYNVANWTQLQVLMAHRLGVAPGTYTHFADSLHLYTEHRDVAGRVGSVSLSDSPVLALPTTDASDALLATLWDYARRVAVEREYDPWSLGELEPGYWSDYALALALCLRAAQQRLDIEQGWDWVSRMTTPLKIEAAQVWLRYCMRHDHFPTASGFNTWAASLTQQERAYVFDTPTPREARTDAQRPAAPAGDSV